MRGTTVRGPMATARLDPELGRAYRQLIEQHAGLRLTDHQAKDIGDLIHQLVTTSCFADAEDLYRTLAASGRRDLIEELAARLTIGETHFFRIGPQIDALRTVVLPEIIKRQAARRRLRAWSAGCSTGEEPYTLAILIRELLPAASDWDVQLLATDINDRALEMARLATYGEWSFRGTPDDIRRRYFAPEGSRWRLADPIRRMVQFAAMNLLADPIPLPQTEGGPAPVTSALDLILCRNVTIYFGAEAVRQVYRRYADALVDGGWLVLGPSDPVPELPGPFEPVYLPGAVIWRRRGTRGPAQPTAPSQCRPTSPLPAPSRPSPRRVTAGLPVAPSSPPAATRRTAHPEHASPVVDRVLALARHGDRAAARAQAGERVRGRPLDAEAHLLLGLLDLDAGTPAQAIESLRRATFLDDGNILAWFSLGRAYVQLGDRARARGALAHAQRLLQAVPDTQEIPHGDGLTGGELRHATLTQLTALDQGAGS